MTDVVPLAAATEEARYGAKAVGLANALAAGLPVPPGIALAGDFTDRIAIRDEAASAALCDAAAALPTPLAVRSSCVDEDGAAASFAGQHLTVLNVDSAADVAAAVREIWWSANSDAAVTYRRRVGAFTRPSVGVVVQSLVPADVAGVMFTRNPVTGADERVVEASWGLGEAVVSGRVIPDTFRIARDGTVLDRRPGLKRLAIRAAPGGGTVDAAVDPDLVEALCLDDVQLRRLAELADACERAYGAGRDIEWAFCGRDLYLLQCRAVTRSAGVVPPQAVAPEQVESLGRVSIFESLPPDDRAQIARLFKERRFRAGETVTKEGAGAAAFFLIESGTAHVTVRGEHRRTLTAGDHFGEIALLDDGARTATVTAATDLVCQGLTTWEFRPLVQEQPRLAWALLQSLARLLREAMAEPAPAAPR